MQLGLNINANGGTNFTLVNNTLNTSKTAGYGGTLSVSNTKIKKYNFYITVGPRYSTTESSLQSQFNDSNWSISSNAAITIFLPGKVEVFSDARYMYTEKTQAFSQSINPFIWNTTISKKFLKKENLKFSLSGSDLLNQNVGFSRQPYTQSSYTTIQRYFMGSLTWDFTKIGGAAAEAQK